MKKYYRKITFIVLLVLAFMLCACSNFAGNANIIEKERDVDAVSPTTELVLLEEDEQDENSAIQDDKATSQVESEQDVSAEVQDDKSNSQADELSPETTGISEEEKSENSEDKKDTQPLIDPEEYYYDLEHVVLYLETYGELPLNYITKKEAQKRGWEGGSVEDYVPDAAIGGDYFGNFEKQLPSGKGIKYTECDIDTHGYKNRGSRRLIFSNEGRYFYTKDHYETFKEVIVKDNKVELIDF